MKNRSRFLFREKIGKRKSETSFEPRCSMNVSRTANRNPHRIFRMVDAVSFTRSMRNFGHAGFLNAPPFDLLDPEPINGLDFPEVLILFPNLAVYDNPRNIDSFEL